VTPVSRPRLLFFTYYRVVPTAQMGIFKRCLRLIRHLLDDFEIHLVYYGPLPEEDALFSAIHPRIQVHDPAGDELGEALVAIFAAVRPAAFIHGEAPLRGSMRLSHRIASSLGLWQICIDNYYGEFLTSVLSAEWPRIDRWLLLGLTDGGTAGAGGRIEIVPPFVRFPAEHGRAPRDRVVVLGYDKRTLLTGVRLIGRLPATEKVDILIAPLWRSFLAGLGLDLSRPGLRVLVLPGDEELYASLSRARLAVGKAGFQQVVECISLGTPILCQYCGGGIDASLLPAWLHLFVRFVDGEEDLPGVLFDIAGWLLETPGSAWSDLASRVAEPTAHAALRLRAMIAAAPP
jgi:hypothetical protein